LLPFSSEYFAFPPPIKDCKDKHVKESVMFLVILYGRETWSVTLREEHRLRMFENREPKRIFGPLIPEVTRGWIKLQNEELHNCYSLSDIIKVMKSRR
jgi:hypothetical protein